MAPIPKTIGRYDIIELVGKGGMGVLYRARDSALERDVALKMMLVDFTMDQAARDRFQREAKAVARLQHRNVVTIHELGEADGAPYIVMEFLSGQDLENRLTGSKPMTLVEKLDVVIQLCEGLNYAHEQGIVHRDIKPSNVRVLEDSTVKILDFGIAKFAVSTVTASGAIMGTASYMAPEQIMGKAVDGRADLFSTGVLLHELLAGKKPFSGDSATAVVYQIMHVEAAPVRTIVPDLPEALDEIVMRALQKNPDDRYSRASEMASDLQMVKMMLDLPLNSGEPPPAGGPPGTPSMGTARLYATTIGAAGARAGAVATAVLKTPMRGTAEAALADAAPRAADAKPPAKINPMMIGIAAVVVVAIGIAAMMWSGGSKPAAPDAAATAPPAATLAEKPVAPTSPASAPATPAGTRTSSGGKTTGAESAPPPGATGRTGGKNTSGRPAEPAASSAGSGAASSPAPVAAPAGPPPAAGAHTELLVVSSSPSGARISINGQELGKSTPQALQLTPGRPNTIQLVLRGYQTLNATISDSDIRSGNKDFNLVREAGAVRLSVSAAYPFELIQGEKVLSASSTRHEVTIEPGSGAVFARNKEFMLNKAIAIDFQKGQVDTTLANLGTLSVFSAVETCSIDIDGQSAGFPPVANQKIWAGEHTVTLKCPDGKTDTKKAIVVAGEKISVQFGKPKGQ